MAINTRNRRAACIGFGAPQRTVFPNPDGSLASQDDRQQSAYAYPGILASSLIPITSLFGLNIVVPGRAREFLVSATPAPKAFEIVAPPPWRTFDRV